MNKSNRHTWRAAAFVNELNLKQLAAQLKIESEADLPRFVEEWNRETTRSLATALAAIEQEQIVTPTMAIQIWRYEQAPAQFRALSPHGGGETWIALLPDDEDVPSWMESPAFGRTSRHPLPDGSLLMIATRS